MSASGLTFINTVFKAARGLEFYKGFGNPDTLIDCTMPVDTPHSPVTWMAWDVLPVHQNLFSLTYHVKDASGKPIAHPGQDQGPSDVHALARADRGGGEGLQPVEPAARRPPTARPTTGTPPMRAPSMRLTAAMSSAWR